MCELRTLIRLPPLMICTLVPHSDSTWNLYIEPAQLVEILCGLKLNNTNLMLLQDKIYTFFPKIYG